MDLPGRVLMQIAKRKLMIKAMTSPSASSLYDSATTKDSTPIRIMEQTLEVLEKLVRLCNSSVTGSIRNFGSSSLVAASVASLKINHAQCRFLDLQSFHDNVRNLVDEMASLDSVSCEQCRAAAVEIAKVTRNAELLVWCWVSSEQEDAEDFWMVRAIVYATDEGFLAAQQHQDQQWCVAVMEVVLAQFRAGRGDSFRHQKKRLSNEHQVPYWMIERTFEIAEEALDAEADRGLLLAVRLDRKNLLDKLRKLKHKQDGFFFKGLAVFNSKSRRSSRVPEITSYLITKLDGEDDGYESYIERIHQSEAWPLETITTGKVESYLLGTGSFGTVHKSNFLGFPAALKITAFQSRESFWNEVSVLSSLRHPRLCQLIFATITNDEGECRLWTELLKKNLDSALDPERGTVPLPVAVELMLQIAEGMAFLHKRGVLHRRLNAFNVLVVPNKSDSRRRKRPKTGMAGSFSLHDISEDDEPFESSPSEQQLPFWQAPEAFQQDSPEAASTKKSDVYSFGMLCFQILSCRRPFSNQDHLTEAHLYELVSVKRARPDILPHCPAYLAALIRKCWSHEQERRPSFKRICLAMRTLKALMARRRTSWQNEHLLPITESDFSQLTRQLGMTYFVDTILLHKKKQQGEDEKLFIAMLDKDKGPGFWPFSMENFVLWLASSVEQLEHEEGFGAAAEIAGDLMANWIGPNHEFEQAVFWYYKASSGTVGGSARWKLAMCLENGFGIAKDEKRAFGLYKQAAREGCASAHLDIGRCYQTGKGVEPCNADKAVAHFAKALEMIEKDRTTSVESVEFLMKMLATAPREEDCIWAANKLQDIASKTRLGRIAVAGKDCYNVRELVGMLGDWKLKEFARKKAKLVLERLAVEEDILQQALLA